MDSWTQVSEFVVVLQPVSGWAPGGLLTILATFWGPHFLSSLSLPGTCCTSTAVFKKLLNSPCRHTPASSACLAHRYFFFAFGAANSTLLWVMASNRYLAICGHLHYVTIVNVLQCALLAVVPWISANLISIHAIPMAHLFLCTNRIPHFCNLNDTQLNKVLALVLGGSVVLSPLHASWPLTHLLLWLCGRCPQPGGSGKHSPPVSLTFVSFFSSRDYYWGLLQPHIHTHHSEGHGSHCGVH